jgi:cytochrome c
MKYLPALIFALIGVAGSATAALALQSYQRIFSIDAAVRVAGQKVFAEHCAVCHVRKSGGRTYGPSLNGVLDRPAASVKGFPYSDVLKKSGLVWTEDNLRKWIADNQSLVPSTPMPHVSIENPAEQFYLLAYLKSLKAPAAH